jgi:hypothetical protein
MDKKRAGRNSGIIFINACIAMILKTSVLVKTSVISTKILRGGVFAAENF